MQASNSKGVCCFQLYRSADDQQATSKLTLVRKSVYEVTILVTSARVLVILVLYARIMLTFPSWPLAWRHNDVALGKYALYQEQKANDLRSRDRVF
jgi:hypothetical protein